MLFVLLQSAGAVTARLHLSAFFFVMQNDALQPSEAQAQLTDREPHQSGREVAQLTLQQQL
jgi:hypothetical protein